MSLPNIKSDLFVVGGGPAGLAAAIAARAQSFTVAIGDRQHPPIDKACGEGLMPNAVAALEKLGIQFTAEEAVTFRGIRFIDGTNGLSVEAAFSNGVGLAVRRNALHSKLVERAAQAGVSLLWNANIRARESGLQCNGADVHCRWIVAADGYHSQIRRWAGFEPRRRAVPRFGFTQHFEVPPWTDFVEVYWGLTCQAAITPTGANEVGVAVLSRDPQTRLESALKEMPALAARLADAKVTSRHRGAPCSLRRLPRVCRDGIALIGDASGSVDPATGEGLGLSFEQALALANALRHEDLTLYEGAHRCIGQPSYQMSRLLLFMDRHPGLRRAALRALSAEPALFDRMLKSNVGEVNASSVPENVLRLGSRMARLAWPS